MRAVLLAYGVLLSVVLVAHGVALAWLAVRLDAAARRFRGSRLLPCPAVTRARS